MKKAIENAQQKLSLLKKPEQLSLDLTKTERNPNELSASIKTLFKIMQWSWLIPYNFVVKTEDGTSKETYRTLTSKLKKLLIWTILAVVTSNHMLIFYRVSQRDNSFQCVIRHVITFSLTCWSFVVITEMHRKRKSFAKILTQLDDIVDLLQRNGAKVTSSKKGVVLVALLAIGCTLMSFLETSYFVLKLHRDQRYLRIGQVIWERAEFYLNKWPDLSSNILGQALAVTLELLDIFINKVYYFSIGHFGYAVLFTFCVVIAELYKMLNVSTPMKFTSQVEIDESICLYNTLRAFTTEVNKAIGIMMAWGILGHLPYNAYKVNDLISGTTFTQVSYVVHILMYFAILYAGANAHSQINLFADKLSSDALSLENAGLQSKVGLLLQQSKMAGIRSGGLFQMTYGFLGNIIGVILTYAILIVQFRSN